MQNPGSRKTCRSCGAPQPEDVQFEQPHKTELIKDKAEITKAKQGPDIHCPFCGTRNPTGSKTCKQCGGDLAEGKKRQSGRVVGAFRTGAGGKIICPTCNAQNPPDALECAECGAPLSVVKEKPKSAVLKTKRMGSGTCILFTIIAAVVIGGLIFLLSRVFKRMDIDGSVQSVNWQRSVVVEQLSTVQRSGWRTDIPQDAVMHDCTKEYSYTSDEPEGNYIEVCGTPYSVDKGSGFAEVVQDCEYEVYEEYCDYEIRDWVVFDTFTTKGDSINVRSPAANLTSSQRLGEQSANYVVYFETEEGVKRFETDDYDLFRLCQPGAQFELTLDGFGNIVDINYTGR